MKIIDQAKLRFYLLGSASDIGDKSTRALLTNVLLTTVFICYVVYNKNNISLLKLRVVFVFVN